MPGQTKSLVLIGCGYLGGHVIQQAAADYLEIVALVRSTMRLSDLNKKGVKAMAVDIFNDNFSYKKQCPSTEFEAIFMVPPSAIAEQGSAIAKVVEELANDKCASALLISSTGVYGQPQNEVVSAESQTAPNDDRSKKLASIEAHWLAGGRQFKVLRLAGIYGPGRIIGQRPLAQGQPVQGDGDAWLNLIHVADAASLSLRCLGQDARQIELGSDGSPVKRKDYYGYVAKVLGYRAPQFSGQGGRSAIGKSSRNSTSKKCDPGSTHAQLSWAPRYQNYRLGLDSLIDSKAPDVK